jgi:hypothetical protein
MAAPEQQTRRYPLRLVAAVAVAVAPSRQLLQALAEQEQTAVAQVVAGPL